MGGRGDHQRPRRRLLSHPELESTHTSDGVTAMCGESELKPEQQALLVFETGSHCRLPGQEQP